MQLSMMRIPLIILIVAASAQLHFDVRRQVDVSKKAHMKSLNARRFDETDSIDLRNDVDVSTYFVTVHVGSNGQQLDLQLRSGMSLY